jgi:excisionase family DNA binding protein
MGIHIANATQNTSLILRPKNAAKTLGVSIATFWRLVKSGHIETIKIGKRATGVRRADIERLVENGIDA